MSIYAGERTGPDLDDGAQMPRISTTDALRRRPLVALAPIVLLAIAAIVLSQIRSPNYTAKARLSVTGVNLDLPGALPGFSSATQALALRFSLMVDADGVIAPAAEEIGIDATELRQSVTASPVPESSILILTAKGDEPEQTQEMANSVSKSLVAFVAAQSEPVNERQLLRDLRKATAAASEAEVEVTDAQRDFAESQSQSAQDRLAQARTTFRELSLEQDLLQRQYRAVRTDLTPRPGLTLLRSASTVESDRGTLRQILLFAALLIGGMIGVALAVLGGNADLRREMRRR